jgi:5'-nucleotidase
MPAPQVIVTNDDGIGSEGLWHLAAAAAGAAFSLEVTENSGPPDWAAAADVAARELPELPRVPGGVVLNVNVPSRPEVLGIRRTGLASFGAVQTVVQTAEGYLQVNVSDTVASEPETGSDSASLAAGYATVTTLRAVCETSADGLPWPEFTAQ